MPELVDNDTFLKQLADLFEASKEHGSIWLTHKRLTHDGTDASMKRSDEEIDTQEYPCLLRAVGSSGAKFSTQIQSGALEKFHAAYGTLLKASMTTLRKRDKKREKQHADLSAKRKRRMTEPVIVEGPKRGSGRKIRQRRVKAALKQQASQQKFKEREEAKAKGKST